MTRTSSGLLVDAFERIQEAVMPAVEGLTTDQLNYRVDAEANTITWLVWHLTRVQDDHIAAAAGSEQLWTGGGWADRFGLPFDVSDIGYGHSSADVAAVRVATTDLLTGYFEAVHERTVQWVGGLTDADLDRVVDASYDPPVTLAVRLVSILADDLQHVGQAAFLRGVVERSG